MADLSVAAMAALPEEAEVTMTVKQLKQFVLSARTALGPEYASARELARTIGFGTAYWQRLARVGTIPGCVQATAGAPWQLPVDACRAHIRGLARKPAPKATATTPTAGPRLVPEYRPRAPRQTLATAPARTARS